MNDLDLNRLCAEALGMSTMESTVAGKLDSTPIIMAYRPGRGQEWYDPLNNKAQAFELLEKFAYQISCPHSGDGSGYWVVETIDTEAADQSLNRAIVVAVAGLVRFRKGN